MCMTIAHDLLAGPESAIIYRYEWSSPPVRARARMEGAYIGTMGPPHQAASVRAPASDRTVVVDAPTAASQRAPNPTRGRAWDDAAAARDELTVLEKGLEPVWQEHDRRGLHVPPFMLGSQPRDPRPADVPASCPRYEARIGIEMHESSNAGQMR